MGDHHWAGVGIFTSPLAENQIYDSFKCSILVLLKKKILKHTSKRQLTLVPGSDSRRGKAQSLNMCIVTHIIFAEMYFNRVFTKIQTIFIKENLSLLTATIFSPKTRIVK